MGQINQTQTGFFRITTAIIFAFSILLSNTNGLAQNSSAPLTHLDETVRWSTTELLGPEGSVNFGGGIYLLPNRNLLIIDVNYSEGDIAKIGAVYLYDKNLTLIHRLTGSQTGDQVGLYGVKILPNGDYLVLSPNWDNKNLIDAGSVTWCSGITGCNGEVVSANNSLIGSSSGEKVGTTIKLLGNGNYLIVNDSWANGAHTNAGAVTWCSSDSGCFGEATSENSLVGVQSLDRVGLRVTELADSDYVVQSFYWHDANNIAVGAATLCSGTGGCTGTITPDNSLVGSQDSDAVGSNVIALEDGNYVVNSPNWNNGNVNEAGAVTWCNGDSQCVGIVSSDNSLVGGTANDHVGSKGVFPLSNGNYAVSSPSWSNDSVLTIGAVTWCSGNGGCKGLVVDNPSLEGSLHGDQVGSNGIITLDNGNYVVKSAYWRKDGKLVGTGAVTFCDGLTGCSGKVSQLNSLIDTNLCTKSCQVGMDVIPLADGNFVVSSPYWNGSAIEAGAVTWCDGVIGCSGSVSVENSLVGSHYLDHVGDDVYGLPGGRYVVSSPYWANGTIQYAGAVTFCGNPSNCTGPISSENSLVGEHTYDNIGSYLSVLKNGNYVTSSWGWDNSTAINVGQITWCSGLTGCIGTVLSNHSLIGEQSNSAVGGDPIVALDNGNYVAASYFWQNDGISGAGAATWCEGDTGCDGILSPENSLVGSQTDDHVGNIIHQFGNGNYIMIHNTWSNGGIEKSGAVTMGAGNAPVPLGIVSSDNSVLGMVPDGGNSLNAIVFDETNGQLVVGKPKENLVTFLTIPSTAIADGAWDDPKIWDFGVPAPNGVAIISSGHSVTVTDYASVRNILIQDGGTLALADGSSLDVQGDFNNQGQFSGLVGAISFVGSGVHLLNADLPTRFGNLKIQSGAVLEEEPAEDFFSVVGTLDNQGIIRKTQIVQGVGTLSFGLTGLVVDLSDVGGLYKIQVDRVDQDHPDISAGTDIYQLNVGTYWSVQVTQTNDSAYLGNLYFPNLLTNENQDKAEICQFDGVYWDCGCSGSNDDSVWLDSVAQIVGDWTIGQEKDQATVHLNDLIQVFDGESKPVQEITMPPGLSVRLVYIGMGDTVYGPSENAPTNSGNYIVQATIIDNQYFGSTLDTLTIFKADQSINFDDIPDKIFGDPDFEVDAVASSGLPIQFAVDDQNVCVISNNMVHLNGTGICVLTAMQSGNQNYEQATSITHSFTIGKANAAIYLEGLSQIYNGYQKPITIITVPANLSFTVLYQSSDYGPTTEAPILPGEYTVIVQIDDMNYQGEVTGNLVIGKLKRIFLPLVEK
jgi:hypothetical protein